MTTHTSEQEILLMHAELDDSLPTLDLHGQTMSETATTLDHFLHQHSYRKNRVVKINHGKGSGLLQKTCEDILKNHPCVERYQRSSRLQEQEAVLFALIRVI